MDDYRNSLTCMAKTGLLFLRDCGDMAINNCHLCGRPLCREHSIDTGQGIVCPECAASKEEASNAPGVSRLARRHHYYSRYGYVPYYYGHTRYYSDQDYRTFDGKDTEEMAPPEEGTFVFSDDEAMES